MKILNGIDTRSETGGSDASDSPMQQDSLRLFFGFLKSIKVLESNAAFSFLGFYLNFYRSKL